MDKSSGRTLQYKPLKVHRNEIRLFRLKSKSSQPVRRSPRSFPNVAVFGELEHISRDDQISYTALSYTWGDAADLRPIGVGPAILYVSWNLEQALLHLQHETDDLLLWADQVCINQQNDEEKTEHVQQMDTIFCDAEHVIAWLGSVGKGSDLVMDLLSVIGSDVDEEKGWEVNELDDESFQSIIHKSFVNFIPAFANSKTIEMISTAFHQFCKRPYWRRLWIIQEFAVASKLDIMCGNLSIPSYKLRYALDVIARILYYLEDLEETDESSKLVEAGHAITQAFTSSASSYMEGVVTRRHRYQSSHPGENPLFYVLISSLVLECDYNHPECSDPRDRIFAMLGLADDALEFDEFPDYTMSCKDIYTKATKKFLDQGHIDILSYCRFPRANSMPTWIPDWRLPILKPNTYIPTPVNHAFSASRETLSQQKISYRGTEWVTLKGVFVDEVKEFGSTWSPNWLERLDPGDTLKYLAEIKAFTVKSPRISPGSEDVETARIAIADFANSGNSNESTEALTCYRRLVNEFSLTVSWTQQDRTKYVEPWYNRAMRLLHSRRPFISSAGLVGLAPSYVETGDMICIFLGGNVPYLLRKYGKTYILVGEIYVHGIMYGEFMAARPKIERFTLK